MRKLSLNPDEDMRWIYNHRHPEYNSPRAQHLRDARAAALRSAPEWMIREAQLNDMLAKSTTKGRGE